MTRLAMPGTLRSVLTQGLTRVLTWALLADLVCVLAFALGGRSAHDEGSTVWVAVRIAWPFALAALAGHVLAWRRGWDVLRWRPAGFAIVAVTYVLGMVLRVVTGRGIAITFLIVALLFLALTMLGWRLVNALWATRSSAPRSGRPSTP